MEKKSHFHINRLALNLTLKQRPRATRKLSWEYNNGLNFRINLGFWETARLPLH